MSSSSSSSSSCVDAYQEARNQQLIHLNQFVRGCRFMYHHPWVLSHGCRPSFYLFPEDARPVLFITFYNPADQLVHEIEQYYLLRRPDYEGSVFELTRTLRDDDGIANPFDLNVLRGDFFANNDWLRQHGRLTLKSTIWI